MLCMMYAYELVIYIRGVCMIARMVFADPKWPP